MHNRFIESFLELKKYCEHEDYLGWDPFDGLNSKVFQATPLKHWNLARLAWIQIFKRNPLNLRKLLLVPKDYNAKGIGLFLTGYCNIYKYACKTKNNIFGSIEELEEIIHFLANLLVSLQSKGFSGACWGYNFDWQNRIFFQPKFTPTAVVTSFCADALFKAFEITNYEKYLNVALSSGHFIENDLNRTYISDNQFILSYSPFDNSQVYNASLLGARILAQCNYHKQNKNWLNLSISATQTIVNKQSDNGSWKYGEDKIQSWIDSFHTGFNLECIKEIMNYTGNSQFVYSFDKGLQYYLSNFFLDDGTPKYYNDKTYPVDIHSPAQLLVTLARTNKLNEYINLADRVLNWTITNMQSSKGYFYYQLMPIISSKISYIRWSQAWMFYAFSNYLNYFFDENLD
jgi:hypothetical protein